MKKLIFTFIILTILAVGALYLFIPSNMIISQKINLVVNAKGFNRIFPNENQWYKWWPGKILADAGKITLSFQLNKNDYTIIEKRLNSIVILINNERASFHTELYFLALTPDSITLNWEGNYKSSRMPITRLKSFYEIKKLKKDLQKVLQTINDFYSKEENIYGMQIKKDHVIDSTLISTTSTSKGYPTVESIYNLITQLKKYAAKHGAKQTGFPMLNINTSDSISYLIRVALPVDKKLKNAGTIVYRWMLGSGNILVTEVKGGIYSINNAFEELENYIMDHNRIAPAIPFQSLVTDRSKEADTSKWITRAFWPVM
jgi:hypothetical protein